MTDDKIEATRARLLMKLDTGEPPTDTDHAAIAQVARADGARPLTPWEEAVRIVLDEAVAATDRDPRPGLSFRDLTADPLEVITSTGELFTRIPRSTITDLVQRIERGRALATHG
jgi:hypothetical protein